MLVDAPLTVGRRLGYARTGGNPFPVIAILPLVCWEPRIRKHCVVYLVRLTSNGAAVGGFIPPPESGRQGRSDRGRWIEAERLKFEIRVALRVTHPDRRI